ATLAFLGGGSLAAGGLGMAGGMAVLGGMVAAPALAVLGVVLSAKASANKDKAYSNLAEAKKVAQELQTVCVSCAGIRARACMFDRLLLRLDLMLYPLLLKLRSVIEREGTDVAAYSEQSLALLAEIFAIMQAVKSVLDTALLSEDGSLTEASAKTAENCAKFCHDREQQ
ncbi:MAG: hypothetical protein IAB19_04470, partial [Proteobacteria bacterium]|nr:hypothetical protein [Candidatus Avisuccinivibrio stercorigallinarum]